MTGPFATLLLSLLNVVGFDRALEWGIHYPDDGPPYVLCWMRYPYLLVRAPAVGGGFTSRLMRVRQASDPARIGSDDLLTNTDVPGPRIDGKDTIPVADEVLRIAVKGDFVVAEWLLGGYVVRSLNNQHSTRYLCGDLDDVNSELAKADTPPITDADFRTFEELAEERSRLRVGSSLCGLAIGILPLAGVVLVAVIRRRW